MPLDPYVPCPCGSGTKFRWCCAPYYATVEKAFEQERQGLHDAALQTIQGLVTTHPDSAAVWSYFAEFLYAAGQREKAEEAISEALSRNPNFGRAHFLRGLFREEEGELLGALMLYRKAAETLHPEAHDQLAQVYDRIFRHELLMLNRPVAARAALERMTHFMPADAELREQMDGLFGEESRLPLAARKKYTFRPTAKPISESSVTGKFSDARKAFEDLTQLTPDDPAAWFNLGVVRAWMGEQPQAVAALMKSIELETDDYRAEEASALVEVLRCGYGMENETDYQAHTILMPIREPQAVMNLLRAYDEARKLRNVKAYPESGLMVGMIVEELPSLIAVGSVVLARVAARMEIRGGVLHLSHPNRDSVSQVADEIRTALQLAVEQPTETTTPLSFPDVVLEALAQPVTSGNLDAAEVKLRDHATNFFENVWTHRPRKSLSGNTPIDAAGSKLLRKILFGVIKFHEDCMKATQPHKQIGEQVVPIDVYDFNQLRHKLGLEYVRAEPPKVNVPTEMPKASGGREIPDGGNQGADAPRSPAKREISSMNAAELAGLDIAASSVEELEQAMRAAVKLDARELAVAFAQAGVMKPFDAARPDRYPLFATAITGAASAGDTARAIELVDQGVTYDAEHNAGNRATDYGLKKAQLYVKAKDAEKAATEFDAIIARHPDEGKFYTTAAEEMLRLKNPAKALHFAEAGLETAQRTNNRDLEGHCQEIAAHAKKSMG
ncbi:MAG: tetratricopeptide repeat protein [Planctomycetia bacterium]|nr:tetratricopeptide repeat protein [Planctomycetia bacterium]